MEDFLAIDDRAIGPLAAQCADIAGAALGLGLGQFGDDIVGPAAHFRIAGLLPGQHQRRHVMAQRMPRDRVALPPAIDGRLGLQPGIETEIVEQPIGVETVEITPVGLHRRRVDGGTQPDRRERKWFGLVGQDRPRRHRLCRYRPHHRHRRRTAHPFAPVCLPHLDLPEILYTVSAHWEGVNRQRVTCQYPER